MNATQRGMFMFTEHVAWWPNNQVALTFHSSLHPTQDNKQRIIDSLHLDDINRFLGEKLQLTLRSFDDKDISHPSEEKKEGESTSDEGGEEDKDDHNEKNLNSRQSRKPSRHSSRFVLGVLAREIYSRSRFWSKFGTQEFDPR